jgi:hypothetical protein
MPEGGGPGLLHTGASGRRLLCSARSDMQKPQLRRIFLDRLPRKG